MVDIECTRCGAKGTGYQTNYEAKFSLVHNEKCGAKIGVPKFSAGGKTTEVITNTGNNTETLTVKSKKKKLKKKSAIKAE